MSKIQEVAQAVELGKVKLIQGLVQEALDEGNDPQAILNEGMIGAMNVVAQSSRLTRFSFLRCLLLLRQ